VVPELCNLKANIEIESWEERWVLTRRDPDPIVFTSLLGLRNDTVPLDHTTRYTFLIQKSFENSSMVYNVPRNVMQLDT
jgi:hypothetical protein